ncbi:hypothetical protein [Polymorphospora sp. NPDC050346]|uniref:hypothetical protein n=1 Tax=Polymorphospora sp. NPDC050346 TaxID=3155780 RepID=UPI0033FE6A8E
MDAEDSFARYVRDRTGGTTQLIRQEGVWVWDIDVAHDLVVDGRFGGPSSKPTA